MMRQHVDGVWTATAPLRFMKTLNIGARMTVVRLEDKSLWVHSPITLGEIDLGALGEVKHVIAPNLVHHLFVTDVITRHPETKLYAVAGLEKTRPDLKIDEVLAEQTWGEFESMAIDGPRAWREHVFLHRPSRTLVLTDHLFNFVEPRPFGQRLMLEASGLWGKPAWPKANKLMFPFDSAKLRVSIQKLLEWDFDRVIMAHGDPIEAGGKDAVKRAYRWLLK